MKKIANTNNPIISELINGYLMAKKREDVARKLGIIRDFFITSRDESFPNKTDSELIIWVRGYKLTDQERKDGYLGNFLTVRILTFDKYYWAKSEKIITPDNKNHPARISQTKSERQPNYGYTTVRFALNKKKFKTLEQASDLLTKLQFEYPKVTIRATDRKIYFLLWDSAHYFSDDNVSKVVIKVKYEKEGAWYLDLEANKKSEEIENRKVKGTFGSECNDLYFNNLNTFTQTTLKNFINGI